MSSLSIASYFPFARVKLISQNIHPDGAAFIILMHVKHPSGFSRKAWEFDNVAEL